MRRYVFALSFFTLCSCASLAPPQEVSQLTPALSYEDTVDLLGEMTAKCWWSKVTPLKDGIRLKVYGNQHSKWFLIEGYNVSWNVGLAKNPFIIVSTTRQNNKAHVSVKEGDFGYGVTGKFRIDAAAHITAWLNGEQGCMAFATSLWHG